MPGEIVTISSQPKMLERRSGVPFVDIRGLPISIDRYARSLYTLSQVINSQVDRLLSEESSSAPTASLTSAMRRRDLDLVQQDNVSDFTGMDAVTRTDVLEAASVKHVVALGDALQQGEEVALSNFVMQATTAKRALLRERTVVDEALKQDGDARINANIISKSWDISEGDIASAIVSACQLKAQYYGRPPKIVVWNDIDLNVTRGEQHNDNTPGPRQTKFAYVQYGRQTLEDTVFSVVYGTMHAQDGLPGALARDSFRAVGRRIPQTNILPFVEEVFHYGQEHGVDMKILTRNIALVGDGLARELGLPSEQVYGRTATSHLSTDKPYVVMAHLLHEPNSIHIIVDDGDESLIRSVQEKPFPDGTGIQNHAFLIARQPDEIRTYPLHSVLELAGIPHGLNNGTYEQVFQVLQSVSR